MKDLIKRTAIRICIFFTVAMALWCIAGLIFAGPVEGIVTTLSLLAAFVLLCSLQTFWFTEIVLRRPSYPVRIAGFALTALPALALCAAFGHWVPLDDPGAWISFVVVYLVVTAAFTAGYTLYFRRIAGSYDDAMARYRERRGK